MAEALKVTLPEMGESVAQGSVVEWRKHVGDFVNQGDTLVEITTDKVDVEVPAPASGTITSIAAAEGATVAVGATLAEIDTSATQPPNGAAKPKTKPPGAPSAKAAAAKTPPATVPSRSVADSVSARNGAAATPQARRYAERHQVDLGAVRGSGPQGLILREDVEERARAVPAAATGPALPPIGDTPATTLRGPAAALAGYMEQSLGVPTATSFRTFSVATLDGRRRALTAALKAAGRAEKVSFTHLIAFAIVRSASEIPAMTYSFRRDGATALRVEPGVHLGLAVDVERKDGTRFLVVPVIKDAATLDFAAFRTAYETLVAKARDGQLVADELMGASLTLTNPGGLGTAASVPRLMAGQGTVVAAGAIGYPPGLANLSEATLRSMGVEKTMTLTSTYDHRVIQGAQSGEFLRRIEQLLAGADGFYESVSEPLQVDAKAVVLAEAPQATAATAAPSEEMLRAVAAGMAIVSAYRTHGHLAAMLDPLGSQPPGDPALDPHSYALTPALLSAIPASVLRVKVRGNTLADVLPRLHETYSSTIAYEVEHISNTAQREWLREQIESGTHSIALPPQRQLEMLGRLTRVEVLERYLRKTFLGQKTFSIEGLDAMIPMLEEMLGMLADDGVENAVIGMAHRGRLNVIAHIVNRPYEEILAEFEAANVRSEQKDEAVDVTGDVKYHQGAQGRYETSGGAIAVTLSHNPSHLEAVDAVVEGRSRALQTGHETPIATLDFKKAAPILVHGDAAFTAQGVVAEVFNLQALAGYATGGTLHLIANNQVGFTTDPTDSRSTRYSSDLAKGFDVPIVHVNADDIEACISAVHLAVEFRKKFGRDIIIDLIGYRRFGHNEQDEPAYTQPAMYDAIKSHPTARELFANKLIAQGAATAEHVSEEIANATERIAQAHKAVKDGHTGGVVDRLPTVAPSDTSVETGISRERLERWSAELVRTPEGFAVNRKLETQFERRAALLREKGLVDWGMAEALAFAGLLCEGIPVRLTGQDTERGTFSHRHLVLHAPKDGAKFVPMQHLTDIRASFEIYNSPLSEYACLGFEYGYSGAVPHALVLWEAQFGDFENGAQIVVDQFVAAGQAKWGESSRLTLLLPHGYEGAGPEHSSARLERFLQLSAERNLRVANCSTSGQYFHLLRAQAHEPAAIPLVVMTPKSLLRAEASFSTLENIASGRFAPVLDDPNFADRKQNVERIILCSGKVYYDLTGHADYAKISKTAILRVELLSPLPHGNIRALIASYPNAKRLVWVQEEPKNMGARAHVRRRLLEHKNDGMDIEYVGRSYRASPSEGYPGAHAVEQERIVRAALRE